MHLLFTFSLLFSGVASHPLVLQNITIEVPQGTSNHGDRHILCRPTRASDLAVFFLGNYVAHAATLKGLPGQPPLEAFVDLLFALLFPVSGVVRGINAIYDRAALQKTPLGRALKAGALCELVRTEHWQPEPGDRVRNLRLFKKGEKEVNQDATQVLELDEIPRDEGPPPPVTLCVKENDRLLIHATPHFDPIDDWSGTSGRQVHGNYRIPRGYALAIVPPDANVQELRQVIQPENPQIPHWRYMIGRILNRIWGIHSIENRRRLRQIQAPQSTANIQPFIDWLRTSFPIKQSPGSHSVGSSQISSSYSVSKGVIAIFQLVFASFTLVRTRGDQVNRYGCAAFGLTVAPYLIMSFVNLLSALLSPDYSHLYLVSSETMREARRREGCHFDGVIGAIEDQEDLDQHFNGDFIKQGEQILLKPFESAMDILEPILGRPENEAYPFKMENIYKAMLGEPTERELSVTWLPDFLAEYLSFRWRLLWQPWDLGRQVTRFREEGSKQSYVAVPSTSAPLEASRFQHDLIRSTIVASASVLVGFFPLIVVGGLSKFRREHSSVVQLTFTMSWLATGIIIGPMVHFVPFATRMSKLNKFVLLVYSVPTVGGMVVVGKMIQEYGTCIRIY